MKEKETWWTGVWGEKEKIESVSLCLLFYFLQNNNSKQLQREKEKRRDNMFLG
jgi:hypothetical protein